MSNIPNFFVIGAMKSGTSSMYRYLFQHPGISLTKFKEANFFSQHWSKGIVWYQRQFRKGGEILGDVSPSYSRRHLFPEAAARMAELFPNAKIVYLIRPPYDRIISHLKHDLFTDRVKSYTSLKDHLRNNPDYILTSDYYYQIEPYLDHFDRSQIFVIKSQELSSEEVLLLLFRFLKVTEVCVKNKIRFNKSENKKRIPYYTEIYKYVKIRWIRNLYFRYFQMFGSLVITPKLDKDDRGFIRARLEESYNNFDKIFGLNIKSWLSNLN